MYPSQGAASDSEWGKGLLGEGALLPWPPVQLRGDLPAQDALEGPDEALVAFLPGPRIELEPEPDSELP